MVQLFINTLKWVTSTSFFILGVYCLRLATDEGTIKPIILVIFSFGIVYWMSHSTYEASKKVFLTGLALVLAVGLATRFYIWPLLLSYDWDIGYYMSWGLSTIVLGIPIMGVVFWKEG